MSHVASSLWGSDGSYSRRRQCFLNPVSRLGTYQRRFNASELTAIHARQLPEPASPEANVVTFDITIITSSLKAPWHQSRKLAGPTSLIFFGKKERLASSSMPAFANAGGVRTYAVTWTVPAKQVHLPDTDPIGDRYLIHRAAPWSMWLGADPGAERSTNLSAWIRSATTLPLTPAMPPAPRRTFQDRINSWYLQVSADTDINTGMLLHGIASASAWKCLCRSPGSDDSAHPPSLAAPGVDSAS